jgi:hypothetical protein
VRSRIAAPIVRGRESRNKFRAAKGPVKVDSPLQPFVNDVAT